MKAADVLEKGWSTLPLDQPKKRGWCSYHWQGTVFMLQTKPSMSQASVYQPLMTTITTRHAVDLMRSIQIETSHCILDPLLPSIITAITRSLFTPSKEVDLHVLPYLAIRVADSFQEISFSDWFTFHQILLDLVLRQSLCYPVRGSNCILSNL